MEKRSLKGPNGQLSIKLSTRKANNNESAKNLNLKQDFPSSESAKSNESATANGSRSKKCKGLVNLDYCSYCDEGGNLLNCDRCPASFHLICQEPPLTSDQIPKGEFLCNKCKSKAKLLANQNNFEKKLINQGEKVEPVDLPISNETKTINFEIQEDESPLETLIQMAKSFNPRQMELSDELSMECAFDLPGLNKIKWWSKESNRIVSSNTQKSSTEPGGANSSGQNGLFNSASSNSLASTAHGSSSNSEGSQDLYHQKFKNSKLINENSTSAHQNETCFICLKLIIFFVRF